jgi:hypothetical protein
MNEVKVNSYYRNGGSIPETQTKLTGFVEKKAPIVDKYANQDIINFSNMRQKVLFDNELVGQISDGMWENSTPHNHWEQICRAKTIVDDSRLPGINFRLKRRYNFASKELFDCVGQRMKFYVKAYIAFPEVVLKNDKNRWELNEEGSIFELIGGAEKEQGILNAGGTSSKYYIEKLASNKVSYGVSSNEDLVEIEKSIKAVNYSDLDCKKDLKAISDIVNNKRCD